MIDKKQIDKIYRYNRKFNSAFNQIAGYSGTDGESKVQQLYDAMFDTIFNTTTERIKKCDCYFDSTVDGINVVGLCEYKFDIDMTDRLAISKVIAQLTFYYKRIIEDGDHAIPNVAFIGDKNELLMFPTNLLNKYLNVDGVDYGIAPSSAGTQMELVKLLLADEKLHSAYFIMNPSECELLFIYNKAKAIAEGKGYKLRISTERINRVFDAFVKCIDDDNVDSNDLVSTFLDAIRNPERVCYANDMFAVPGHMPLKADRQMGSFLAHFDKPRTSEESEELTRLYDTLVKDVDRRKHGFFITPRTWTNLAHKYMEKVLGENWEMNPNYIVWDNCAGTKSLTRDYRFANLYLSTIDEGEFKATEDLSPEAKETFIFDWLNDSFTKLPKSLYNELNELRKHPEKKLVFLVNPPYGKACGESFVGTVASGSNDTAIQEELKKIGLTGALGTDLFIQFNYRMAKISEEFKMKDGQLVIGTFNNPTWMNGTGSMKFLNWYTERMNFNGGFLFNASEFNGCKDNWGISFAMFTSSKKDNECNLFRHDLYENDEGEAKLIGEKKFVNPTGQQTMDEWIRIDVPKGVQGYSLKDGLTPIKFNIHNRGICSTAIGFITSMGNLAQNNFTTISTRPITTANGCSVVESNFSKACVAYSCRDLGIHTWYTHFDNYFAPAKEVESSSEFKSWARDCVIYSCFSYQTSIQGTVDGESYDYHNAFCPFKKSEVMAIRGTKLMVNETDEVPYVVDKGYTTNMSTEASDVITKYRNLLAALEPFRKEFSKKHPELQLDRWDAGLVQYKGTKKTGFFAKEYAKKEYDEFIESYKKLGDKVREGIYNFGFLTR